MYPAALLLSAFVASHSSGSGSLMNKNFVISLANRSGVKRFNDEIYFHDISPVCFKLSQSEHTILFADCALMQWWIPP